MMSNAAITYDVFLSYNWREHDAVEAVARVLRDRGLRVFLDRWYLVPGRPWPQVLEGTLDTCHAVAVFLGPQGMGPWQQREKDLALDRQSRTPTFPVIPVLLPGADPALGFLSLNTWVDMRAGLDDPLALATLTAAVRGEPPGPDLQERLTGTRATVCPYRGLRPFREEDAAFFFGREAFTARLAEAVARHSLVAVVGASGSGKSSVVRAGLVPCLRRQDSGCVWNIVTLVPGDRPLHALAAALLPLLEPEITEIDQLVEVGKMANYLAEGHITLRDVVTRALAKQPGTDRLLLVVDQWEELYTLSQEGQASRRFLEEVLDATAAGSLSVVLTLRGDFFGHALGYRPLTDRLQGAVINLGPLTRDELARAVQTPAHKVGLTFESGLVERILADVGEEPGNLPLLEFALTELWEERRGGQLLHAAYEAMGAVQGAIARRAEDVFEQLTSVEQDAARWVFMQLVRPGEQTEDTRRRATFVELGEAIRPVVQRLADARLVVTGHGQAAGEETVEVAHEALIRTWSRLRGWLDADRAFLLWRQRLRADLTDWERTGRDHDTLLRGAPLGEAEHWLAERPGDLSLAERSFIQESVVLRERERTARERSRRRLTYAAIGAAGIFLILTGLAGWQWWRADGLRQIAQRQELQASRLRTIAEHAQQRAEEQLRIALARQLSAQSLGALETEPALGLLLAVEAAQMASRVDKRVPGEIEHALHQTFLASRWCATLPHDAITTTIAFSPDGSWMATVTEHSIYIWDVATQTAHNIIRHDYRIVRAAFSSKGRYLATYGEDGYLRLWEVPRGIERGAVPHGGHVETISVSGVEPWVTTRDHDGIVRLWDMTSGSVMSTLLCASRICAITESGEGPLVAMAHRDGSVSLQNLTSGAQRLVLGGQSMAVQALFFNQIGSQLVIVSREQQSETVILWDILLDKHLKLPPSQGSGVGFVAFSPDSAHLATTHSGGVVSVWNIATGTQRASLVLPGFSGYGGGYVRLAFSPNSIDLGLFPDGLGGPRYARVWYTARLWSILAGPQLATFPSNDAITAWAFSSTGDQLALASREDKGGTVRLWDTKASEYASWDTGVGRAVALSPAGTRLATSGADGSIHIWDIATGQQRATLVGHVDTVEMIVFNHTGDRLITTSSDNTTRLWDTMTGKQLSIWPDQAAGSSCSPKNDLCAIVWGEAIQVWDVHTGQRTADFGRHISELAKFSPPVFSLDGRVLATSEYTTEREEVVLLWNVVTGKVFGKIPIGLGFSADGKWLTIVNSDGRVSGFYTAIDDLVTLACTRVARNLTHEEWRQFLGDRPYHKTCFNLREP